MFSNYEDSVYKVAASPSASAALFFFVAPFAI
jgi:hypothetical protein